MPLRVKSSIVVIVKSNAIQEFIKIEGIPKSRWSFIQFQGLDGAKGVVKDKNIMKLQRNVSGMDTQDKRNTTGVSGTETQKRTTEGEKLPFRNLLTLLRS